MNQNENDWDDTLDTPEVSQADFIARLEDGEELKAYVGFGNVYSLSKRKGDHFILESDTGYRIWQQFATLTDALLAFGLAVGGLSEPVRRKMDREAREREGQQ